MSGGSFNHDCQKAFFGAYMLMRTSIIAGMFMFPFGLLGGWLHRTFGFCEKEGSAVELFFFIWAVLAIIYALREWRFYRLCIKASNQIEYGYSDYTEYGNTDKIPSQRDWSFLEEKED